jgi:STE24 endopeptidase
MDSHHVTQAFLVLVLLSTALQAWLALRQMRHVAQHRVAVPALFHTTVPLESHQKAADYTLVRQRFDLVKLGVQLVLLLLWTLGGGIAWLNGWLAGEVAPAIGPLGYQVALLGAFLAIGFVLELPLDAYSTFRIEQRFGLNRMGPGLWIADQTKSLVVTLVLLLPLAALILWLMGAAGPTWWLWAWGAYVAFTLLLVAIYPTLIAPLFNRFEPLADAALAERLQDLMNRCGFASRGLFVMDGSRRSAESNAYFTGLGRSKRVVLYDTLIAQLSRGELLAVLAHELGHFRLRHVPKQLGVSMLSALGVFAALGWLAAQPEFYAGLGAPPPAGLPIDALALVLFLAAAGVVGVFFAPLGALFSQGHEFEADAYAVAHADGSDLAMALIKLHRENLATLTPDPVYWRFHASHPTVLERLSRLPQPQLAPSAPP